MLPLTLERRRITRGMMGPAPRKPLKLQDGYEAQLWVSQGWPQRRKFPNVEKNFPVVSGDRTPDLTDAIISATPFGDPGRTA
jgi:hypothetical protein